jgi:hypothetical protein
MILPASYSNGFAPRDGQPLYPELWKGCVGAWNPGLGPSGVTLRDWSNRRVHGSMLDLVASAAWQNNGGRYSVQLAGATQRLDLGDVNAKIAGSPQLGLAFWARRSTTVSAITVSAIAGVSYVAIAPWTDGNVYFQVSPNTPAFADVTLGWNHWAMTLTNSTLRGYKNGVQVVSSAGPAAVPTLAGSLFAGFYSSSLTYSNGWIDDIFLSTRAWSASEVALLASRRGVAYELAPRRRSSVAVAGGGFKAAWIPRRSLIVGGGTN